MEANPTQIMQFFNGFKQSVIPLFQRPYEWTKPQWETLWSDVLERYDSDRETSHFMGAIVTAPAKSVPVGVSKYLVIDGQQRLTTIAILLCAIRDELPEDAKPERNRIQRHYLVNEGYEAWDYLKLLPTQSDRESFKALLERTEPLPATNFTAAYDFFLKCLRGKDSNGEQIDVRKLLDTIENRLTVVSINLGTNDDPYLIFESLNFKGAPLTQADLVRNYFLMRFAVQEQPKIYEQLWLPMQERLGDHLTEFMRVYLMKDGDEVRKGEIYASLKKRLEKLNPKEVEATLRDMNRHSAFYLRFVAPEHETVTPLRQSLDRLRRWDVATVHPLLLRVYDAYERQELDAERVRAVLAFVESYVVRRAICDVPTNQLQKIFLSFSKTFQSTETATWMANEAATWVHGRRWPRDQEFRDAWVRYRAYAKKERCKLVLEALEQSFGHKEAVEFTSATIEHVMPQSLSEEWRDALGSDADDVHERFLDTIGNLTLTGYNPELSNSPFPKKRELLKQSHFELNKEFGSREAWTATDIQSRAEILWERARAIWARPE